MMTSEKRQNLLDCKVRILSEYIKGCKITFPLGMRIGRIKVIFTFPQQIVAEHSGNMTFTNLPQEFLAYVEWYTKLQPAAEKNHLMYKISKPPPHADGSLPGGIV